MSLSKCQLERLLDYDSLSGVLTWRERTPDLFQGWGRGKHGTQSPEWRCARWNKKYAGCVASAIDVQSGYVRVYLFDKHYYAHRIAWVLANGEIGDGMAVDHINGSRMDNRLENLRLVTISGNARNAKKHKDNTSGHVGVFWEKRRMKWVATIMHDRKSVRLGQFHDIKDAIAARVAASEKFGYHVNHGR